MANVKSLDLELSSSQYAYINDASQTGLDISTDFTIEAWIKLEQLPSVAGAFFGIAGKYETVLNKRSYLMYVDMTTNKLTMRYSSDGGSVNITSTISDTAFDADDLGVWIHVAGTADISEHSIILYRDGSSVSSTLSGTVTTIYDTDAPFAIGSYYGNNLSIAPFDGLIDDVRLWSDVRTPTEIANNYNVDLIGDEANLIGYWRLDDNYQDQTSSGNHLTAVNSPVFSSDLPFVGTTTSTSTTTTSTSTTTTSTSTTTTSTTTTTIIVDFIPKFDGIIHRTN